MKASDSATSLTGLTTCDTGCQFCSEGGDPEVGKGSLVNSKTFLGCNCRFATHISCWNAYLEAQQRPVCPNCKKPIQPWRRILTQEELAAAEAKADRESRSTCRLILLVGVIAAILLGLVIYFTVGGHSH